MASTDVRPTTETTTTAPRSPLYSAVVGLAGLGVLLQGVWAGLFIREGHDNAKQWVQVHATGADITIVLALVAAVIAVVRLRSRRGLVIGSIAFLVLLVLEAYVGGEIGKNAALQAIHFPLAMALLGLAVYLPLASARPAPRRP